jgi:hypothetical protein
MNANVSIDLRPMRPRIRRAIEGNRPLEEIAAEVGWRGGVDSFRDALRRQLGITLPRKRSAHAGTSALSGAQDRRTGR